MLLHAALPTLPTPTFPPLKQVRALLPMCAGARQVAVSHAQRLCAVLLLGSVELHCTATGAWVRSLENKRSSAIAFEVGGLDRPLGAWWGAAAAWGLHACWRMGMSTVFNTSRPPCSAVLVLLSPSTLLHLTRIRAHFTPHLHPPSASQL